MGEAHKALTTQIIEPHVKMYATSHEMSHTGYTVNIRAIPRAIWRGEEVGSGTSYRALAGSAAGVNSSKWRPFRLFRDVHLNATKSAGMVSLCFGGFGGLASAASLPSRCSALASSVSRSSFSSRTSELPSSPAAPPKRAPCG